MRLRVGMHLTVNVPFRFFQLMCVKPRKSNVSGFPSPLCSRFRSAYRPNSIRRVLSGWSSNCPLFLNRQMEITPFLLLHLFDWKRSTLLLRIPGSRKWLGFP
ncbi:MAG: hypothetical protein DMG50_22135 [Acidobacteria bacterium]|nr:MAG: hypothetical protein DMG50_22135 [Acidobacteriota bacterium]